MKEMGDAGKKMQGDDVAVALFETKAARGGGAHKLMFFTMVCSIISMWVYRWIYMPASPSPRYAWIGMMFADIIFGIYWIITHTARFQVVYRHPYKDTLSQRYEEKLAAVDIFVCTADPKLEPPSLVIGTILSVMSYNYPSHKLSVYLSDDGGSELTFYGLFEASNFCKYWIPFCNKYNVEPRCPRVYFSRTLLHNNSCSLFTQDWTTMKEMYQDMENRIDSAAESGCVPQEIRDQHKGFSEWNSKITKQDHQSIVQFLIDGRNPEAVDIEGNRLPNLVYVSREKRPGWPHHFKAGAMNTLLRVSAVLSNAPIILNVDCDMYSNDPDSIRDAMCFFLDEKQGEQTSYVQYPQCYNNTTKDDVYANVNLAVNNVELCGLDGFGAALYIGTGCFHRRESLSGKMYGESSKIEGRSDVEDTTKGRSVQDLEDASKVLALCSYEKGSQWGKEMGLVYGCPVEDIVTGLTIQCKGWRPVYYNPRKHGFEGVAPTTLDVSLIQFKRWAEGMFQVFVSKYCPFTRGHAKLKLGAQLGYCIYLFWAPVSLPTLCYAIIPALSLLTGLPLFPQVSTPWFLPFAYFFITRTVYTLVEDLIIGDTLRGWWNLQRMVFIRRTTAYFFAFIDTIMLQLGRSQMSFTLTAKVEDDEARARYEKGIIDFGNSGVMLTILSTLALINLFSLGWGIMKGISDPGTFWKFVPELSICGTIVMLNVPIYEALLLRKDQGRISSAVAFKSFLIASSFACLIHIL